MALILINFLNNFFFQLNWFIGIFDDGHNGINAYLVIGTVFRSWRRLYNILYRKSNFSKIIGKKITCEKLYVKIDEEIDDEEVAEKVDDFQMMMIIAIFRNNIFITWWWLVLTSCEEQNSVLKILTFFLKSHLTMVIRICTYINIDLWFIS